MPDGLLTFRDATRDDIPAIVTMLADDHLGAQRESLVDLAPYQRALDDMAASGCNRQIVAERDGHIVGTFQLTLIPGLSRQGSRRAELEGVRVSSTIRGQGMGSAMIAHAIDIARAEGCVLLQFTTDKSRADAHRFYERLGFVQSHLGYKMSLV